MIYYVEYDLNIRDLVVYNFLQISGMEASGFPPLGWRQPRRGRGRPGAGAVDIMLPAR